MPRYPSAVTATCVFMSSIAFAQTAESFPSDYLPEDFLLPLIEKSETAPSTAPQQDATPHRPVTFSVQNMQRTPGIGQKDVSKTQTFQKPQLVADTFVLPSPTEAPQDIPEDLWKGTTAESAETVLHRLIQQGIDNRTAYDLLHRILLSEVSVPSGTSDVAWLATRAKLLLEMHLAEDAYRLMAPVQPDELAQHPALAETWTVTTLLSGQQDRACGYVKQQVLNTDAPFWRQALLVCQTVQGESKALELSLNLVDDAVAKADPTLIPLLKTLLAGEKPTGAQQPFTALKAVAYAAFPQMIQTEMLPDLPDMMLRRVMQTEQLSKQIRLQAGELLVNQHHKMQDILALTKLYDAFEFEVDIVKNPLEEAQKEKEGSVARALLWQAAAMGKLSSTRAQALQALWQRAVEDGLQNLPGVLLPRSRNIQPHPNLAWFAPDVIEAALQSGETQVAQSWWNILKANQMLSQDLMSKRAGLLMATAFMQGQVDPELLNQWWQAQPKENADQQRRLQRVLAVLDAVNVPIPLNFWQDLYIAGAENLRDNNQNGPGHVWLRLLAAQLEQQRSGPALLMLLAPLGQTPIQQMAPQTMANIITGLTFLGWSAEAHQLALTALLPPTQTHKTEKDASQKTPAESKAE